MSAPTIPKLLMLNACVGGGSYLTIVSSTGAWTADQWTAGAQGTALFFGNLCYGGLVAQGGRLADHIGRARGALVGGFLLLLSTVIGCLPLLVPAFPAGWAAVGATMLALGGSAFFFPGNAGLFSDVQGGGAPVPLHVKVSRYNIGWSGGNLIGIGIAWLLSVWAQPAWLGYAICGLAYLIVVVQLWPWRNLPAQPPKADGDRAPHPALEMLTFAGRLSLAAWCLIGMACFALITVTLDKSSGTAPHAGLDRLLLVAYAASYVTTFAVLGWWSGWVLKPWRLTALMAFGIPGVVGLWWLGHLGGVPPVAGLIACGACLGIGFAAVYTSSIYYSLRTPTGAAKAAGLHETYLGAGSTLAPLIAGWFVQVNGGDLAALGLWLCLAMAAVMAVQFALIPAAAKLCR